MPRRGLAGRRGVLVEPTVVQGGVLTPAAGLPQRLLLPHHSGAGDTTATESPQTVIPGIGTRCFLAISSSSEVHRFL